MRSSFAGQRHIRKVGNLHRTGGILPPRIPAKTAAAGCRRYEIGSVQLRVAFLKAFDYAIKAAELDDSDAIVQAVLARVTRQRHQHERTDQDAARALALNPNDANVLFQLAIVKRFHDIARLLAQPHEPVHCLELLGAVPTSRSQDQMLDGQARRDLLLN